jgi:hypothetical protein
VSTYEYRDESGVVRIVGTLHTRDGAIGDVPAKQSDGSLEQSPGGGSQTLLKAEMTLTSDQLLSCFDTPIEIVAAPGVGKMIVPVSLLSSMKVYTTGYTIDSNIVFTPPVFGASLVGLLTCMSGDGTNPVFSIDDITNIVQAGDAHDSAEYDNAPWQIATLDANPTGGDGNVNIVFLYYIATL